MNFEYGELFDINNITEEEIKSINLFTSEFVDNGVRINCALRNDQLLTEFQQELLTSVEAAIAKSRTNTNLTLYRVIGYHAKYKLKKGDIFIDKGILEASLNKNIGEVIPFRKYLLIITVPKGTSCLFDTPYNYRFEEAGVLFPRASAFRITKIKKSNFLRKYNEVYCYLLPHNI